MVRRPFILFLFTFSLIYLTQVMRTCREGDQIGRSQEHQEPILEGAVRLSQLGFLNNFLPTVFVITYHCRNLVEYLEVFTYVRHKTRV